MRALAPGSHTPAPRPALRQPRPVLIVPTVLIVLMAALLAPGVAARPEPLQTPDVDSPPGAGDADPTARQAEAFRELRRRLLEHGERAEQVSEEGLARQLAALGEPLLEVVLDLLCGAEDAPWRHRLQGEAAGVSEREGELPEVALPIGPREQEMLLAILGHLPEERVLEAVRGRLRGAASIGTRRVLALALGRLGTERALTALLEVISGLPPEHLRRAFLTRPFEDALSELLRRDPTLHGKLRVRLPLIDPAYWRPIARGIAAARRSEGLAVLAQLLGRHEELEAALLAGLVELCGDPRVDVDRAVLAWLEPYLAAPVPGWRHASALVLATCRDAEAARHLVELLDDADPLVRHAAAVGLQDLSGRRFAPEDVERWRAWLVEEERWILEQVPALRERLRGGDAAEARAALSALELHPLAAAGIAAELARALSEATEPELAILLCAALGKVPSSTALDALAGALGWEQPRVAMAARSALSSIAGVDLGSEAPEWNAWIAGAITGSGRP